MYSSQHTVHCRGVVKFLELKNGQIRLNKELVFFLVKVVYYTEDVFAFETRVIITPHKLQLVCMEFVLTALRRLTETFSDGDVTLCQHT